MSTPPLPERVLGYLSGHTTLNLATHGPSGLWAAAVLYVNRGLDLYFTSVVTTRHGQNLLETRRAAGTINDDCTSWRAAKGIQLEGRVDLVSDVDERHRVVSDYLARFPFATALWHGVADAAVIARDPGIHAFFRLTPARLHFMDNEHHPQGREELAMA
nr:F385 [uncultured bacterium]